jgi:hypothetical protein
MNQVHTFVYGEKPSSTPGVVTHRTEIRVTFKDRHLLCRDDSDEGFDAAVCQMLKDYFKCEFAVTKQAFESHCLPVQPEKPVTLHTQELDGKKIAYSSETYFLVQVGKGSKGRYTTKYSFKGNFSQAFGHYVAINIDSQHKKRLYMPSSPKPVLAQASGDDIHFDVKSALATSRFECKALGHTEYVFPTLAKAVAFIKREKHTTGIAWEVYEVTQLVHGKV